MVSNEELYPSVPLTYLVFPIPPLPTLILYVPAVIKASLISTNSPLPPPPSAFCPPEPPPPIIKISHNLSIGKVILYCVSSLPVFVNIRFLCVKLPSVYDSYD